MVKAGGHFVQFTWQTLHATSEVVNLAFMQCLTAGQFSMCILLSAVYWCFAAKKFTYRLPAWMIKTGNKICQFVVHGRKLHSVYVNIEGFAVKKVASKLLLVMEIITKHFSGSLFWDSLYIHYNYYLRTEFSLQCNKYLPPGLWGWYCFQ